MTRIVAGRLGGRSLQVPKSGTRPTSERVREALFSSLESRDALDGAHVLDLYAGSGALGFEALSRGAAHLTAVDAARPALQVIRDNARSLGVRADVVAAKVATFLDRGIAAVAGAPFSLVFLDPPYEIGLDADLAALAEGDWLSEGAVVVVEQARRSPEPTFPAALVERSVKTYGDTRVFVAEVNAPVAAD